MFSIEVAGVLGASGVEAATRVAAVEYSLHPWAL
jgi:hypothetical protein